MNLVKIFFWTARITGSLLLAFVLFFLLAHIFGDKEAPLKEMSVDDMMAFALFPLGFVVGLILAYKWEGLGGLISIGSMAVLFFVRSDLASQPVMLSLTLPGLLYLSYWYLSRKES